MVHGGRAANKSKLGRLTNRPERSARARPSLNGMALFVMLRPDPSPHVRFSPPATQEVGFANNIRAVPFILC